MARLRLTSILLGEVRAARLDLFADCPVCGHREYVKAEELPLPDEFDMKEIGRRMRCTGCGRRGGIDICPDTRSWVAISGRPASATANHGEHR